MLHLKPFSPWTQILFSLSEFILRPFLWTLNQLISVYLVIANENHNYSVLMTWRLLVTPLCLIILVFLLLPAAGAFLIRCLLHGMRKPYTLSVSENSFSFKENQKNPSRTTYSVVSSNLCLLPEFLSRLNNLNNTHLRAKKIGERIVIDQLHYASHSSSTLINKKLCNMSLNSWDVNANSQRVVTHFPKVDFLCLQETWDRDYSKALIRELHKIYPWILYDVGITSLKSNYFLLNSGLMLASRYPILDADFKYFENSCKQCVYSGKGLLMMKVQLSESEFRDDVGYVFVTHLQAYQGENSVLDKQLDSILVWTDEFRKETLKSSDKVKFDILAGDFNFDNMSPGERGISQHEIFSVYEDVCRVKPGKDQDWTVGTEHRPPYLGESQISTPEGLKEALLDPKLRQRYIVNADVEVATKESIDNSMPKLDKDGNPIISAISGRRRIDYVLYRKDNPVEVQNFNFITRLASLTDHIPVSLTFTTHT